MSINPLSLIKRIETQALKVLDRRVKWSLITLDCLDLVSLTFKVRQEQVFAEVVPLVSMAVTRSGGAKLRD
jgi:hypothetical protein